LDVDVLAASALCAMPFGDLLGVTLARRELAEPIARRLVDPHIDVGHVDLEPGPLVLHVHVAVAVSSRAARITRAANTREDRNEHGNWDRPHAHLGCIRRAAVAKRLLQDERSRRRSLIAFTRVASTPFDHHRCGPRC